MTTQDENAGRELSLVPQSQTFQLMAGGSVQIDPALAAEFEPGDFQGVESPTESMCIVSIRQKEVRTADGRGLVARSGDFRIYDAVAAAAEVEVPDVKGEDGLHLTVLADQTTRTFWEEGNFEKPKCKSIDGLNGVGTPGGVCALCRLSQWVDNKRPECTQNANALVYDHKLGGCYILRIGRSGLRPYNLFKAAAKRVSKSGMPLHALQLWVTTQYVAEPQPHFVPQFHIVGQVEVELFRKFKKLREEQGVKLTRAAEVDTGDDERPSDSAGASRPIPYPPVGNGGDTDGDEFPTRLDDPDSNGWLPL